MGCIWLHLHRDLVRLYRFGPPMDPRSWHDISTSSLGLAKGECQFDVSTMALLRLPAALRGD